MLGVNEEQGVETPEKFVFQDDQYDYPYHHIPYFNRSGRAVRFRILDWGYEYLCYLRHLKEVVEGLQASSVLEVGCGDGRFIGMLAPQIPRRVGVDLSVRAIRFAKAFHPEVEFRAADAATLDETFDVVAAIEVLEHIPDEEISSFLRLLEERATPGGHVVISVPTTVLAVHRKHYRHYDLDLFRRQLAASGADLKIERVDYVYKLRRWFQLFLKFTINRWWMIEFHALSSVTWRYVWTRLRKAGPRTGKHLVVMMRKGGGSAESIS
jgi:SAM-dependent methyltransferase